jgi:hypothetical protein
MVTGHVDPAELDRQARDLLAPASAGAAGSDSQPGTGSRDAPAVYIEPGGGSGPADSNGPRGSSAPRGEPGGCPVCGEPGHAPGGLRCLRPETAAMACSGARG